MPTLPKTSSSTPSFFRTSYKKKSTTSSWRSSRFAFGRKLEPVAEGSHGFAPPRAHHTATLTAPTSTSDRLSCLLDSFSRFARDKSDISTIGEHICKMVLIFIGKSGRTKAECAEFSGIKPKQYELLAYFLEESRLKTRLSYIAEENILIVEMPSAVHEAPLVPFHAAFICFFRSIDFNRLLLNVRVLCNTETSSNNPIIPDLRVSIQDMTSITKKVYVSVLRETALSQNRRTLLKKFRNTIKLNPGLLMAIMAEVDEITGYRSPKKKSCAMSMLRETSPRSSDIFNSATGTLPALDNPVKVEGHTWCSIRSIRFEVWVHGVEPIDLDTTDRNLVACGTLYPVEDMIALHAMIQKGVWAIREQLISLSQGMNPHVDANAMRAPPFILDNDEIVTTIAGAMSETAHHRYMAWYMEQRVVELAKRDAHAAQIYSKELPVFHMVL
ncbi:uncharacterized protein EDB93DRAFT_1254978 [Suillus bovinus]|uniref:uncharacterized protein n=1 Tax=Suillus bovinus TaxID=48563 RepID=UPI001B8774B0|nr:uncharacterized protein EDB93DRAFT_1254978 [Suillus bovinus]KAG2133205.1 hypothetical protein EDB93DRAFT_1254978 [Suillus bovinus]